MAEEMEFAEFTNTHPALADFWHPVAISGEVSDAPVGIRLAGQGWVLVRIDGGVAAFPDTCPHRRARLSAGQIVDGTLQCRYHGWRYATDGTCVEIPALGDGASIPARAALERPAEVAEHAGLVWLSPRSPRGSRPALSSKLLASRPDLDGPGIVTLQLPAMPRPPTPR